MNEVIALVVGFILGLLVVGATVSKGWRKAAVIDGHAEYYINTNTFNKEWRWKEVK